MNSMTGFGRSIVQTPHFQIQVEISGVNRKQAEIVVNVPRSCAEWDTAIRSCVQAAVSRGRVCVQMSVEQAQSESDSLSLHEGKLQALMEVMKRVSELSVISPELRTTDLLRLGIIESQTQTNLPLGELWPEVESAIADALSSFIQMRATEGTFLKNELLSRLQTLDKLRSRIAERALLVPIHLREAMLKRLQEADLPVNLDDERVIRELALFADKCDISEEVARLSSHFTQFRTLCDSDIPAGRPLDFLCQEIFREFNTIGSKANDSELAHLVVAAKTELEKIREQVQNIE